MQVSTGGTAVPKRSVAEYSWLIANVRNQRPSTIVTIGPGHWLSDWTSRNRGLPSIDSDSDCFPNQEDISKP